MGETLRDFEARIRRIAPDAIVDPPATPASRHLRREWTEIADDASIGDGRARLSAAMSLLGSKGPPSELLGQANARALRWVDDPVRCSREADLLRLAPLPWRKRLWPTVRRAALSMGARLGLSRHQ